MNKERKMKENVLNEWKNEKNERKKENGSTERKKNNEIDSNERKEMLQRKEIK